MAAELQPDIVLQDLFDQGRQVGQLATRLFPNGTSIDLDYRQLPQAVEDTRLVLDDGATCIFEASFFEHRTFVAVDVLEILHLNREFRHPDQGELF